MKSFTYVLMLALVVAITTAAPVRMYWYRPYKGFKKSSTAIGGSGGDGGSAVAIGAEVVAGIGGPAVADTSSNVNFGSQTGGNGVAEVIAANGAVGTVIGGGSITGSFSNSATGGAGGAGGNAAVL
ncbi:hypothetical protein FGB62_73g14 [Gracilaria domingensis]|nr:hypothetical protein FGB62_73g14 [Gracilaria domingensis]